MCTGITLFSFFSEKSGRSDKSYAEFIFSYKGKNPPYWCFCLEFMVLPTEIKSECAVISIICSCATLDKLQSSTLVGVQQPSMELSWYYELINASVLLIHARNRVQLFIGNGLVHEGYMQR